MNPVRRLVFLPTSRYHDIAIATLAVAEDVEIAYLQRRFLPSSDRFMTIQEHLVTQGERLDNVTARYLGDPLQFWRVCDANSAMNPPDLMVLGRRLRITMPEGVPGLPNAG